MGLSVDSLFMNSLRSKNQQAEWSLLHGFMAQRQISGLTHHAGRAFWRRDLKHGNMMTALQGDDKLDESVLNPR